MSLMHLNGGKLSKRHLKRKTCRSGQMDQRYMILKTNKPQGFVCPHPGAIYINSFIIFKDLL